MEAEFQFDPVTRRWDCKIGNCRETFVTLENVREHWSVDHKLRPCDKCDYKGSAGNLKAHLKVVHLPDADRPLHCRECNLNRGFFAGYSTDNHLGTHKSKFCFFRQFRPKDLYDRPWGSLDGEELAHDHNTPEPQYQIHTRIPQDFAAAGRAPPVWPLPPMSVNPEHDFNRPHSPRPSYRGVPADLSRYQDPFSNPHPPRQHDSERNLTHSTMQHQHSLTHRQRKIYDQDFARGTFEGRLARF